MDLFQFIEEEMDDDDDFRDLIAHTIQRERRIVPRYESFSNWDNAEFLERFRLTKRGAEFVLNLIRHLLPERLDRRGNPVSDEGKLLCALSFYATGAFMSVCGDRHGLSKTTVCVIVHQVSAAIASLARTFISMPEGPEEISSAQRTFSEIARFPKCIGAIDCTHIRLQSPGGEEPELFRNRKGYFSLNVQTVAGADLSIKDIVARWQGSAHDSIIFLNSQLRRRFERGEFGDSVLVGDKGYSLKTYLLTPINNPHTPAEEIFNVSQIRTRNVVERSYGVWKRRFPVLSNGLRVNLSKVQAIVVATAVLHNVAILLNDDLPAIDASTQQRIDETLFPTEATTEGGERRGRRNARDLFVQYFERL